VRHVPSMSRNLISLSTLDTKGYKYYARDSVLKVTKGSLVVMEGVLKCANLYVLRDSSFLLMLLLLLILKLLKFGIFLLDI
jgi:hypothetical protein